MLKIFTRRTTRKDAERIQLARRADSLRTRALMSTENHWLPLRVVPVLQNGQLARPIFVKDWRPVREELRATSARLVAAADRARAAHGS